VTTIEQLQKEIADLNGEIKSLKARVEALEKDKLLQLGKQYPPQNLPDGKIRTSKSKF